MSWTSAQAASYMRERSMLRRAALAGWKAGQGCIDCGYDDPRALDFDHRPGEMKVRGVSWLLLGNLDRLLEEIAKCDIRCANCHRIKTAERRGA